MLGPSGWVCLYACVYACAVFVAAQCLLGLLCGCVHHTFFTLLCGCVRRTFLYPSGWVCLCTVYVGLLGGCVRMRVQCLLRRCWRPLGGRIVAPLRCCWLCCGVAGAVAGGSWEAELLCNVRSVSAAAPSKRRQWGKEKHRRCIAAGSSGCTHSLQAQAVLEPCAACMQQASAVSTAGVCTCQETTRLMLLPCYKLPHVEFAVKIACCPCWVCRARYCAVLLPLCAPSAAAAATCCSAQQQV